jgi:hypothetical protein
MSTITVTVKLLTGDLIQIEDFDASTQIGGLAARISKIDESLDQNSMTFFRRSSTYQLSTEEKEEDTKLCQLHSYDSIYDGDFLHLLIAPRPKITIRQNNCLELCAYSGNTTNTYVYYYEIHCSMNNENHAFVDFYVSSQSPDRFYPTRLFYSYTMDEHYEDEYKIKPLTPDPLPVIQTLEEYLHLYRPNLKSEYLVPILLQWRMGGFDQTYLEHGY